MTNVDIDINGEIERIIESNSTNVEELEKILVFSNSFQRLHNYFRYVQKRGYGSDMDPKVYWENLAWAYTASDDNKQGLGLIKMMFTKDIPQRLYLMDEEERKVYDSLPNEVMIFRGMTQVEAREGAADNSEYGISWTLSKEVAEFFAYKYARNLITERMKKTVVEKVVPKSEIMAYFDGRKEQEIIYISGLGR